MIYGTFVLLMSCYLIPFVIFILENSDFLLETTDCNQLTELRIGPTNSPNCSFITSLDVKLPFKLSDFDEILLMALVDKDISFRIRDCDFVSIMIILEIGLRKIDGLR